MPDEVKPEATNGATAVEDKAAKPGAPATPAATASGDNPQSKPATVAEGAKPSGEAEDKGVSKGVKVEFFKHREAKRALKDELATERAKAAELERKLAEAEARSAKPVVPASEKTPDPLEDPEGYRAAIRADAIKAVEEHQAETKRQDRLRKGSADGEKWLLTRSHLKEDPKFAEAVAAKIAEDAEIHAIASEFPDRAAKLAYVAVCEDFGVTPDFDGGKSAVTAEVIAKGSTGVRPTASGSVASKGQQWTGKQAREYLNGADPGTDAWKARYAEIQEARSEGRIKG